MKRTIVVRIRGAVTSVRRVSAMVRGCSIGMCVATLHCVGTTVAVADTHYVSLTGGNVAPYTSWSTAATSIQPAIDAAQNGDAVLVGTGTYYLSTELSIVKGVALSSAAGTSQTIIDGNNTVRCMNVNHSAAVVEGFTLMNAYWNDRGGAAHLTAGMLNRCVIKKNTTADIGGGIAMDGINAEARNCLVYNNQANWGGGIYAAYGRIVNCTIISNYSVAHHGGGIASDAIVTCRNSIVSHNFTSNIFVSSGAIVFQYTCAPSARSGVGNTTNDPLCVNLSNGDYHLNANSPCVNSGTNLSWMYGTLDIDGNPRLANGAVDMGAYELSEGPFVDITNAPHFTAHDVSSFAVAGTNNTCVVGAMWVSNAAVGGAAQAFPAALSWVAPAMTMAVGPNVLCVYGSNEWGMVTNDVVWISRASCGTNSPYVDITNAPMVVPNDVTTVAVAGTNNMEVLGEMWATNWTAGGPAMWFGASLGWTTPSLPLSVGDNLIRVYGTNALATLATDAVIVTRGPVGTGVPCVDLTNTISSVPYDVSSCSMAGTNNLQVVGDMWVTNATAGGLAQSFPAAAAWTAPAIAISPGANTIIVFGSNSCARIANDYMVITRGGTGTPYFDITSAVPALINYHQANFLIGGTNNIHLSSAMWWTNLTSGAKGDFTQVGGTWSCIVTNLLEGNNVVRVYGTNVLGTAAWKAITLRRGYERDLPLLDPLTNCTVREHQVILGQARGRTNITSLLCDASEVAGTYAFDTNTWRFSCVPGFDTAGQTWNVRFIGVNAYGMETQSIVMTIGFPAKGIGSKKPLRFEDADGDLIDIKYTGVAKVQSRVSFDGQRLIVSGSYVKGVLTLGIKQNKDGGDGAFDLRELRMDNNGKSIALNCSVGCVNMPEWRVDSLKVCGKGGTASNIYIASAKTISIGKGTLVGTVAASNGFDTMVANVVFSGRILAGVDASAPVSTTPAKATFKTLKAQIMSGSVVAGRDLIDGNNVVVPVMKVKAPLNSTFYHTKIDNTIQAEPITAK